MNPEAKVEQIRLILTTRIEEASKAKDIKSAEAKLLEAEKALDDERSKLKVKHPMLEMLKDEVDKLLKRTKGRWEDLLADLLAFKRSLQRQRKTYGVDLFKPASLLHDQYVQQATEFEKDPSRPPPSVEEDIRKQPIAAVEEPVADQRPEPRTWRIWEGSRHQQQQQRRRRTSGWWAWAAFLLLCTALATAVIIAGAVVFAVYLLYRPRMPYLAVSDARLEQLRYGQDGAIDYLQVSITVLAVNNNSKADASFPAVDLAVGFNGADVALLRAEPFVVARESTLPLQYNVVSAGRALDAAGMQAMDEAVKAGVVPLDLFGKARTRWKVGVFVRLRFWTRISCRLRFFFPGNGTVMPTDRDKCRSKSP